MKSKFQVTPRVSDRTNTTTSVSEVTDKSKRTEHPRKDGVYTLNALTRLTTAPDDELNVKPVTCDEQEERLTEAEVPREPIEQIGKRVYMVDEIGDENLVPNEIGDENLVPKEAGDENPVPSEIGSENLVPKTEPLPGESLEGDSDGDGTTEWASLAVQGQVRVMKDCLELKLRTATPPENAAMEPLARRAAWTLTTYQKDATA